MRVARASVGRVMLAMSAASCQLPDAADYAGHGTPGADSGLPAAPDGGATSNVDASAADAGGTTSAGSSGCKAHPDAVFCADFDGAAYDEGFVASRQGGTLDGSTAFFTSAPRSLVASLPSRASSRPHASLDRQLPVALTTGSMRVSWAVRIPANAVEEALDVGAGIYRGGSPYCSLFVRFSRQANQLGAFSLFQYCDATSSAPQVVEFTDLERELAPGRFMTFELRVRVGANASSVTALIDGTIAVANAPLELHRAQSTPHLVVGIVNSDGAGDAISVNVDDVVVESP